MSEFGMRLRKLGFHATNNNNAHRAAYQHQTDINKNGGFDLNGNGDTPTNSFLKNVYD
jgi:hypothetical protein